MHDTRITQNARASSDLNSTLRMLLHYGYNPSRPNARSIGAIVEFFQFAVGGIRGLDFPGSFDEGNLS